MKSPIRKEKKHQTHNPTSQQEQFQQKLLYPGQIIAGRFKLIEKVGQGSFGSIFKTENIETGEICASKFEKRESQKNSMSLLVREIKILLELKGIAGFPQILHYGRDENYNFFMITYLGQNLENLIRKTKKFSQINCLRIGLQLLERLEQLHLKNLIHRDLKPENIVIGWQDIDVVYLIDFGLSKYYKDNHGNHIPMIEKKGIIGTARYASIGAHLGREQSRRDDLESLAYVLIYLNKGKLPWMNLPIQDKSIKYSKILEQKQSISHEKLCDNLPKCYYLLLQHAKSREYTEQPNYAYIKEQFSKALGDLEYMDNISFDWEKLPEMKSKKSRRSNSQKRTTDKKPRISITKEHSIVHESKQQQLPPLQLVQQTQQKSQVSFLNVPDLDSQSPDKQSGLERKSRGYLSRGSAGTTRLMNYDLSQIEEDENDGDNQNHTPFLNVKKQRKDLKSLSVMSQNQVLKFTTFCKQAGKTMKEQQIEEVNQFYGSFDNLDLIANDEIHIQIHNIGAFSFKKH
ncbi:unnamed protein product (macronuclear) [Paramecium tetraurelia]|uniref:Casein kinase I n=1 Tax=Paramecium tetraurelia TaxID=5888 RepID=A0DTX5_PARTE|nr:uncharacterized protein GSPATT00020175001 [Paramecium tetraurelia]CAK86492.1 unnamed protein product [Paramecium tetraurelia]|eukprot:XP_001453889.1 hypothetical protein (macronuclear) [Paramecium tetraurelia strain d4-2]